MALFVREGSHDRMLSWHNKYAHQDVILCGTGPSLWQTSPEQLRATGKLLFGINNSFELISLDFWMAHDNVEQFSLRAWEQSAIKFYNWEYREEAVLQGVENLFFYKGYGVNNLEGENEKFDEDIVVEGPFVTFIIEGYTFFITLQMLNWLGFGRVFLVGCDFGGDSRLSKLSPAYVNEKCQDRHLASALKELKEAHEKSPIEFISCTPSSPINEFLPYCDIASLKV